MTTFRHALCLLLVGLTAAAPPVFAQDEPDDGIVIGRRYDVADHNSARVALTRFERHAKEGDWSLAVEQLQKLLDLPPEDGVVIEIPQSDPVRFVGAAAYARSLFRELPAEAVAAWEEIHRDPAERLLARGLELRRIDELREVARRFPARDLQQRAHDAVARLANATGNLALAARHLEELLEVVEPEQRPQALARLALTRAQMGDSEGVDHAAARVGALGDALVPAPEGSETLDRFLARMRELVGPRKAAGAGWTQVGGGPEGLGVSPTPPAPDEPRWNIPARTFYVEGSERERQYGGYGWGSDPPFRGVEPAVAYGTVYFNNGLSVRAVDLASGEPVWTHQSRQRIARWRDNPVAVQSVTVADDVVYAAVATDSRRPPDAEQTFLHNYIIWSLPHRTLVALDARTGEELWSHDGPRLGEREDRDELLRDSVASPPVVVGDDLFVTMWSYSGSYRLSLVCFDRRTGDTRWRRSLVQGQQEINLFGRPVKELVGPPVAVRDGTVFVATGLGIVAGVERTSGEIRWLTAYQQTRIPDSNYWWQTRDRSVSWWPSAVAATPGVVVVAPPDGARLSAYEADTGRLIWERMHARRPHSYHWLLGVLDDTVYVAGSRAAAFDLATGMPAWSEQGAGRLAAPLEMELPAVGRGLLTEEHLHIPTDAGIAVLDRRTGVFRELRTLSDVRGRPDTGTLVSGEGALIVATTGLLDCYYDYERVRDLLLQRLVNEPDNARLRLDAGGIFRSAGRLDDAVSVLREGLQLVRDLPPAARDDLQRSLRRSLYESLLARSDERRELAQFEEALADLEAAAAATQDPARAAAALFAVARVTLGGLEQARGRAALERISTEFPDVWIADADGQRIHAGATAEILLGDLDLVTGSAERAVERWLSILARHGDESVGPMPARAAVERRLRAPEFAPGTAAGDLLRTRARQAVSAARRAGDADALTEVARLYPVPEVMAEAALAAARLRLTSDEPRSAISLLARLARTEIDDTTRADVLWLQAQAYEALDAPSVARSLLERLLRDHPETKLSDAGRVSVSASRKLEGLASADGPDSPPAPRGPFEEAWVLEPQADALSVLTLDRPLSGPREGDVVVTAGNEIALMQARDGSMLWRTPTGFSPRIGATAGPVIAAAGDGRGGARRDTVAAGFMADTGTEAWRLQVDGTYHAGLSRFGTLYLITAVPAPNRSSRAYQVTAIDTVTGDILAIRRFDETLRGLLTLVGDTLVVYAQGSGTAEDPYRTLHFLDAMTLATRGRRPFRSVVPDAVASRVDGAAAYTTAGSATVVALDPADGTVAWTFDLPRTPPHQVKRLLAVPGGVLVTDTRDHVRMLSESDGSVVWEHDLSGDGQIPYAGEAVGESLVVVAVQSREDRRFQLHAYAVDDGRRLWTRKLTEQDLSAIGLSVHRHQVAVQTIEMRRAAGLQTFTRLLLLDRGTGETLQVVAPEATSSGYADYRCGDALLLVSTPQGLRVGLRPAAGNGEDR